MLNEGLQEIEEFLKEQPGMSLAPSRNQLLILKGKFSFCASLPNFPEIKDFYNILIILPHNFPYDLPAIVGLDDKVREGDNPHLDKDRNLCLGVPLQLKKIFSENQTFSGFIDNCLVPYFYGVSYNKIYKKFPFGEIGHEPAGALIEYQNMLGLSNSNQVKLAFKLLGMRERIANKEPCPCGCGNRLGKCGFRIKLKEYRRLEGRSWYNTKAIGFIPLTDLEYKKLSRKK